MASEPSFPRFSKFPPEIRTMIWRLSFPEGRIVPIRYQSSTTSYVARIHPPSILHATRESRHEGLKAYHELNLGPFQNSGCYVDLRRDTVYLKTDLTRQTNLLDDLQDESIYEPGDQSMYASRPIVGYFIFDPKIAIPNLNPQYMRHSRLGPVPFRSHSKIILNDLLSSEDGRQVFKRLHVDCPTWSLMRSYLRWYRHKLPAHPKHVCLVYERGDGIMPKDIVLREIDTFTDGRQADVAELMSRSFTASNRFLNRRDEKNSRPAVLVASFKSKYLDKIGGDYGLQLLMSFAGGGKQDSEAVV